MTVEFVKEQFTQVVEGIEEYKRKDPKHAKELLDDLYKKTDKSTRELIHKLKK